MITDIVDWIHRHEDLLQQFGTVSLILLLVTVVFLPIVVIKLPVDYFEKKKREPASRERKYPLLWGILSLVKNLFGLVMILGGVVMLVLPGQGMVTILAGLALTNFPGKYSLQRRIACRPEVCNTLNKIREWAGEPPFTMETEAQ